MKPASSALATGERIAAWIALSDWRDCSAPFTKADAEMVVADFNRRHARPGHAYQRFEYRAVPCGRMFVVQRKPRNG